MEAAQQLLDGAIVIADQTETRQTEAWAISIIKQKQIWTFDSLEHMIVR